MIGDKNKFVDLKKERRGKFTLGNDGLGKIFRNGTIQLGNEKR